MTTQKDLIDEYYAWCVANGLPFISADEQDVFEMTEEQRKWINDFIRRWDEMWNSEEN